MDNIKKEIRNARERRRAALHELRHLDPKRNPQRHATLLRRAKWWGNWHTHLLELKKWSERHGC